MYIKREAEALLRHIAKRFPILGLVGPRQSGKTTLLKNSFADYRYVNLEDIEASEYARSDPKGFLKTYRTPLIIDEAQRVPRLFSQLQVEVDENKQMGEYILSGSQNFLMMEKVSQSLAGRISIQTLLPLAWKEIARQEGKKADYQEIMVRGQYPRLYENHSVSTQEFYSAYVATYLERDLRQIINVTDLASFQRFLKICAGRVGQEVNLSTLAQDAGLTHNTARAWLSVLQTSYIIYLLPPYYRNFNKRLVKRPKLYFYDSGLAAWLLSVESPEQLQTHFALGALFENLVVTEYLKDRHNNGQRIESYFWRDQQGKEIDLVLDRKKLTGIEIKAGRTVNEDYFTNLKTWKPIVKQADLKVVYGGESSQNRKGVAVVPWRLMEELWRNVNIK